MVVLIPPSDDVVRENVKAILADLESNNPSFAYDLSQTRDCQEQLKELIEARGKSLTWYKNTLASYMQSLPSQQSPLVILLKSLDLPDFLVTGKRGKPVYKLLSEDDIDALPDTTYLIDEIIEQDTVTLLVARSGTGKTFLALDWAYRVAFGISWLDRRIEQGNVIYIYAEGIQGLKRRKLAWRKYHDDIQEPANNLKFLGKPVALNDAEQRQWLLDTIADQDIPPTLLIIDTFSNCAPGIDQNKQAEVHRILAVAHEIKETYHCTVLIIHHDNKEGMFNGSQAFRNHVDAMLSLLEDKDSDTILLKSEKQRDGVGFPDIALQRQVVNLYAHPMTGKTVTSCVMIAADSSLEEKPDANEQDSQKIIAIIQEHGKITTRQLLTECQSIGISKRTYYATVRTLHDNPCIVHTASERNGKAAYYEYKAEAIEQEDLTSTVPTVPNRSQERCTRL